jgi:hypothetical protein
MARAGELQTAPNDGAVQHRYDRSATKLDRVEHAMPHPRMGDAAGRVTFGQFRQIEPGGEMVTLAMENDGPYVLGKTGECNLQSQDCLIVESISFFRTAQANECDASGLFNSDRWRHGWI